MFLRAIQVIHHWDNGVTTMKKTTKESSRERKNKLQPPTRQDRATEEDGFPMAGRGLQNRSIQRGF